MARRGGALGLPPCPSDGGSSLANSGHVMSLWASPLRLAGPCEMLTSLYLPSVLPREMHTHWLNFFIAVKLTPCRISVPFSGV